MIVSKCNMVYLRLTITKKGGGGGVDPLVITIELYRFNDLWGEM